MSSFHPLALCDTVPSRVHHDTDLYDLTVKTKAGTEVIHTTSNHLFWDPAKHQWVPAGKLKKGEHLKTPDGALAVADGGTTPKQHDGWMWDLTVPGNNDHDFYVLPEESDSGGIGLIWECKERQITLASGQCPASMGSTRKRTYCWTTGTRYGRFGESLPTIRERAARRAMTALGRWIV